MANSYSPMDARLKTTALTLGANIADEIISRPIQLSKDGSLYLRIDVKASAVTVGGGITAKLQMRSIDESWADLAGANASVSITGAGMFSMTQLVDRAVDQPNMPLKKQIRVLLSTGAASAVTIDEVRVSQGM